MNWKIFDRVRKNANPVELDLIENYAAGRVNRRDFLRRAGIIGLSAPMAGMVLAACGDSDSDDTASTTTAAASDGGGPLGGNLTAAIQFGDANSGLDPLNMLDLGTYSVLSQSFEYLVGLAPDGNIGNNGLASDWSPSADGTVWTFNLREGVTWHDGTPFTSADVAATIDRLAVANGALAGIITEGATDASDPNTAVVTLEAPNGNFPVLVSIYNPQSLITPADYSDGTTLNERPAGTGPWVLDSHNPTTFETIFTPNPTWWGGSVKLDSVTLKGFESAGTMAAAMAAREIDMLQQFNVIDGGSLLQDDGFTVLRPPSANHRQVWFNTQEGQFTDPRARQAVAYAINRAQLVATLYEGQALIANDHPIHPTLPFFDSSAVEQRVPDAAMARQLLADAGFPDGLTTTLNIGNLQEIPDMAAIVEQNLAEVGITASVSVQDNSDFYGAEWCPGASWAADGDGTPEKPCGSSSEIGIVDYGHRPVPDVFFSRALKSGGDWNSSNYASAQFDQLLADYQGAIDVEGQTTAITGIQQVLHEDTPACYPIFFDYLSGHDESVQNVQVTALGHMQFHNATKA